MGSAGGVEDKCRGVPKFLTHSLIGGFSGRDRSELKLSVGSPIVLNNGRLKGETIMVAPISGGTAFDFGAAAQTTVAQTEATTAPAATAKQPTKIEPASDTVRLSDRAQVHLLRTQGQTVAQIAISTALTAQAVNSYLGISPAAPPPVAASNK